MIIKKNVDSMGSDYMVIAQKILGEKLSDMHYARDVYFITNDSGELVGMVCTTPHDKITLRINALGALPRFRKRGTVLSYLRQFIEEVKREGWLGIIGTVEPSLLEIAVKAGFRVIGYRTDSGGNPFIEVLYDYGRKSVLHTTEGKKRNTGKDVNGSQHI